MAKYRSIVDSSFLTLSVGSGAKHDIDSSYSTESVRPGSVHGCETTFLTRWSIRETQIYGLAFTADLDDAVRTSASKWLAGIQAQAGLIAEMLSKACIPLHSEFVIDTRQFIRTAL